MQSRRDMMTPSDIFSMSSSGVQRNAPGFCWMNGCETALELLMMRLPVAWWQARECVRPPLAAAISPTRGENDGRAGFPFIGDCEPAAMFLPPCGGDGRQARGGIAPATSPFDFLPH